jgi:DNA-binding transcriptional regulator YdaS (Cro superfamily)
MLWLSVAKCMMPVAKNLKLADALGISTCLLNQRGLPLSFVSANANVSRLSSISSAIRLRILNLCSTGVTLQKGNAFCAA